MTRTQAIAHAAGSIRLRLTTRQLMPPGRPWTILGSSPRWSGAFLLLLLS
jgi:hypothetical protein